MKVENITVNWIINADFLIPAFISVSSLRKYVNVPVVVYYEEEITPEISALFAQIGADISMHSTKSLNTSDDAHISNRFSRFSVAANSENQTIMLIDADTAFNSGIEELFVSIQEERKNNEGQAIIWGNVEFEHTYDAWLYFNKKDKEGNDLVVPKLEKQEAFQSVFGSNWKKTLHGPQFNNGLLAFHNGQNISKAWETFYVKGMDNDSINMLDDQVPLAAAMHSEECKIVKWPNSFNSKGYRSGDYVGYHLWAGRWMTELMDVEQGVSNLSDYAKIAKEFWHKIPENLVTNFVKKVKREPNQFKEINGIHNFESTCTKVIEQLDTGQVVELGTYKGRTTCFIAELIKNARKDIAVDTIDSYTAGKISKDLTEFHLRNAGVLEFVNVYEDQLIGAASNYVENSLDLIVMDVHKGSVTISECLNAWYEKLKEGGTIVGVDYSLPEQLAGHTDSEIHTFCKRHQLSFYAQGVYFTIQKKYEKIPLQFHFCWFKGKQLERNKPFSYVHYLCLLSVIKLHPEAQFNFYCNYKIENEWFEIIKDRLTVIHVDPPTSIYGQPLKKVEHQADIFRFQRLFEKGGIYLDLDVFCKKPFDDLLTERFVMGEEAQSGLCNAVLMSEPKSPFLKTWLESYHPECKREGAGFNPDGWAEMSVHFPMKLAKEFDDYIRVMPPDAFFHPIGTNTQMEILFNDEQFESEKSYCHHLWESQSWEKYLKTMNPSDIMTKDGYFFRMVRSCLTEGEVFGEISKSIEYVSI